VPRHIAWLITRLVVDYFASRRSTSPTSTMPRVRVPRHVMQLVVDHFTYVARPGASTRNAARRRLLRLRRASGCFGTSRGSSRGSSRRSSSTPWPMPRVRVPLHIAQLISRLVVDYFVSRRSSSTTSTMPHVWVPWHVARLITRLVTPLVVDYFAYAVRPGASASRAARHQARRRLLRLRCASGCLGTSLRSSRRSSSTTSPTPRVRVPRHVARLITRLVAPLVVDFFAYAARPGASARRTARRAACHRLLHLRRALGCLGTSRGSLSATSTTSRVRVPRHVARYVAQLVVDYFTYAACPGASAHRAARHAAHRRLLRAPRLCLAATLALLQPRRAS
jgi:hypothetical protein